ncbi:uncharacterized protein METZ01_LOCUS54470 [marine metagenome]|uniref:Uncharacterized protein n=1 Tax=marine metagenome TaxID=408172 RepID=A0A381SC65_9ZZZZ
MIRIFFTSLSLLTIVFSLPLQIGDNVPDFSVPICANGTGDWNLYDNANGLVNGGNYKVVWMPIWATW